MYPFSPRDSSTSWRRHRQCVARAGPGRLEASNIKGLSLGGRLPPRPHSLVIKGLATTSLAETHTGASKSLQKSSALAAGLALWPRFRHSNPKQMNQKSSDMSAPTAPRRPHSKRTRGGGRHVAAGGGWIPGDSPWGSPGLLAPTPRCRRPPRILRMCSPGRFVIRGRARSGHQSC
jgi:hypothetical protein